MAELSFTPPYQTGSAPAARTGIRRWLLGVGIVLLLLMVLAGASVYWYASNVYWPSTPSGKLVSLEIAPGKTVTEIANQLYDEGLVTQPFAFAAHVRLSGKAEKLQSGGFQIPQHISIAQLVEKLQQASRDEATLRFLEGWRREELVDYIQSQHDKGLIDMTGEQFSRLALEPTPALRAKVGSASRPGDSLQGFLFPDTYVVNKDDSAEQLIGKMLDAYARKVTSQMRAGFQKQGLSEYQALILAAIVEREAFSDEERPIIAGILLSRLKAGIPLGVDATIQYALGYSKVEQRWWRHSLTMEDLAVESPYNTRKLAGLPPHPICNPGISAIQAVARPADTDYLYYLHDGDGHVHYAKTLDQHNTNVAKYLR
jgi:UPF0755 protein